MPKRGKCRNNARQQYLLFHLERREQLKFIYARRSQQRAFRLRDQRKGQPFAASGAARTIVGLLGVRLAFLRARFAAYLHPVDCDEFEAAW